jgi:pilus assembly protein FimV
VCKPIIKSCLFLVTLLLSFMVSATGLGKFTLNSYLGQSLKAEIDLVSVKKEDISSLKASLASSSTFNLANVDYAEFLDTFEFSIQNRANGQSYVKIISSQPLTDPSFSMLVKLDWPAGNLIREYTVYLEHPNEQLEPTLPEMQQATSEHLDIAKSDHYAAEQLDSVIENLNSKENTVSNKSISKQRQIEPELQEEAESSEPEDLSEEVESELKLGVTTYGPVKNGDTLYRIVQEETLYNVHLNQMLVALYRANPEAFSENNMNRLKTGFILHIPDENEVAIISPEIADKEVTIHTANWEAYRQKLATNVTSIVPISEEPEQMAAGEITTIPDINTETVHGLSEGLLRLSKGVKDVEEGTEEGSGEDTISIQEKFNMVEDNSIAGEKALNEANERISLLERAMEENKIANEKELIDSNQRIMSLEKNIKELRNLLKLKNLTMASAEAQADNILSEASDSPPTAIEKPVKVVQPPVDSVEKEGLNPREESNPSITNSVLWVMILLLIIGLWWKVKQSRTDNKLKSSDTF